MNVPLGRGKRVASPSIFTCPCMHPWKLRNAWSVPRLHNENLTLLLFKGFLKNFPRRRLVYVFFIFIFAYSLTSDDISAERCMSSSSSYCSDEKPSFVSPWLTQWFFTATSLMYLPVLWPVCWRYWFCDYVRPEMRSLVLYSGSKDCHRSTFNQLLLLE